MNVRNCRKCGKVFNYIVGPNICPACREDMEKVFQDVKKYIYDHPGATVPEVAEACDVESRQIYQWLREERLQFKDANSISLPCESCGTPIAFGKYCEKCKRELTNGLNNAFGMNKPSAPAQKDNSRRSTENKMRFLK